MPEYIIVLIVIEGIMQTVQLGLHIGIYPNIPFSPQFFYNEWKLNRVGSVIVCILAYILFPIWGLWSLVRIGRDDEDFED